MLAALLIGAFASFVSPSVQADSIVITNNSFDTGGTGYWTLFNAPSSWANNFSAVTPGASFNAQVVTGAGAGLTGYDGADVLSLNLDVGGSPANGTSWVSTKSLGTYQSNTVYTLTVAEASTVNVSTRAATIALAAQGTIPSSGSAPAYTVASTSTNFSDLSTQFTDVTVILNTRLNPAVVGEDIAVLLEQNSVLAQYGRNIYFDNVRLTDAPAPIPEPNAMVLFGLGGLVILVQRHVRRRCAA